MENDLSWHWLNQNEPGVIHSNSVTPKFHEGWGKKTLKFHGAFGCFSSLKLWQPGMPGVELGPPWGAIKCSQPGAINNLHGPSESSESRGMTTATPSGLQGVWGSELGFSTFLKVALCGQLKQSHLLLLG